MYKERNITRPSDCLIFFFFQAEDGIRDYKVTGVQTCALPISRADEQADLRVAEAVDRLHRIAHDEQRAPIALLPGGGEGFEQLELRQRGVLELIDRKSVV